MTASKLITCILDKSTTSFDIVRALKDEHQITRANVGSARGTGTGAKGGLITMPQEKHILQIIVDADRADTIFEWLHDRVELDSRYGAFMFQEELISAGTFTVPDAPEEEG
tara:strand:- start:2279 stop:2611 length:333 start_codon:yes stop_codon:yes gene_type:complete